MSLAKPIALAAKQGDTGGAAADEVLQGWQDEDLGKKLIDPLFFGGSKLCNITAQVAQGLKASPRKAQQPAAQPSPKGSKSGSMQSNSISATATASIAARAQLETHAGLQQRLQQASRAPAGKLQLPLHKLNMGAEYAADNPAGPDDWTIPTAVATVSPASSPKPSIKAERVPASAAGTVSNISSRVPLPGQLGASPAATAGTAAAGSKASAVFRAAAPAVPRDTVQQSATPCTAETLSSAVTAPSVGDYTVVDASSAAQSDATAFLQVQQQQRPSSMLAPTQPAPAAPPAVLGRTRMADAKTTKTFKTGQVIHYQLRLCAQAGAASSCSHSSTASSKPELLELELELLGCYGVGAGEMYVVRLLQDVAVPAAAFRHHKPEKISSSSNTVMGATRDSECSAGYVQFLRGQQFALKLRDREIPMLADRVSVLRKMMRKASCLTYAKQLKAGLAAM